VGVAPAFIVGMLLVAWDLPFGWLVVLIAPVVALLIGWLTVSVDAAEVVAQFGVGLIRKRISLVDVRSCEPVRNPWYYGFGIRWIPGGWLYNVSGYTAVDFTLRDGRHVRIGTPEPAAVCASVASAAPGVMARGEALPAAQMNWIFLPPAIIAASAVLVVGFVLWNGQRPIEASVGNAALVVSGGGFSARVPFTEIQDVSLVEQLPPVTRKVNGFAMGSKLRGTFDVAGVGRSKVFVDRDVPPFVVVKTTNGVLIVNGSTADATRRLRDDLARASVR
jgi:hypothetical protein